MLIYWLMFAALAAGALAARGDDRWRPARLVMIVAIILIVGLRFRVGADWDNYVLNFRHDARLSVAQLIDDGEMLYRLLNWGVAQLGGDIVGVNLVAAALFGWGLHRFVGVQREPWLALLVALSYLIIVVAMGYTRQSIAIGLVMAGLASVRRGGNLLRFLPYVVVAALFHRTAIVAFPLVMLARTGHPLLRLIAGGLIAYALYLGFIADSMEHYWKNYVDARYASQGAAIRVAMCALPALILLGAGRRLFPDARERSLWRAFAWAALGALAMLIVSPSSTAVDRLSLYLLPLQLAVLAALPAMVHQPRAVRLGVVAYAAAVQAVWLGFAAHARFWVPYQFAPLQ